MGSTAIGLEATRSSRRRGRVRGTWWRDRGRRQRQRLEARRRRRRAARGRRRDAGGMGAEGREPVFPAFGVFGGGGLSRQSFPLPHLKYKSFHRPGLKYRKFPKPGRGTAAFSGALQPKIGGELNSLPSSDLNWRQWRHGAGPGAAANGGPVELQFIAMTPPPNLNRRSDRLSGPGSCPARPRPHLTCVPRSHPSRSTP